MNFNRDQHYLISNDFNLDANINHIHVVILLTKYIYPVIYLHIQNNDFSENEKKALTNVVIFDPKCFQAFEKDI